MKCKTECLFCTGGVCCYPSITIKYGKCICFTAENANVKTLVINLMAEHTRRLTENEKLYKAPEVKPLDMSYKQNIANTTEKFDDIGKDLTLEQNEFIYELREKIESEKERSGFNFNIRTVLNKEVFSDVFQLLKGDKKQITVALGVSRSTVARLKNEYKL